MTNLEAILAIGAAKGKTKVDVIKSFDDETTTNLKHVVTLALDPFLSYYMKEIPEYAPTMFDEPVTYTLDDAVDQLMFINSRGGARATDKDKLSRIVSTLPDDDDEVLKLIVGRDLKCGAGLGTFRKVWGDDFLPEFPVALTGSYNEAKIIKNIKFKNGAYSQLKSDGARCVVTQRKGKIVVRSRNGNEIAGMDNLVADIKELDIDRVIDFDLDGELVAVFDGVIQPREIGNGLVNKAIKGTITKEEASTLTLVAWDLILHIGEPEEYSDRLNRMTSLCESSDVNIRVVETKIVYSLAEAKLHYRELVLRGEEGSILKNMCSLWTPGDAASKRECNGFKLKEEHRAEFRIIATELGKKGSKYDGLIGALVCESECGSVRFKVGSGLKDVDRAKSTITFEDGIVSIIYNGRIKPEGREFYSLFLPRVDEFRPDKTMADTLEKIVAQEDATRELGM